MKWPMSMKVRILLDAAPKDEDICWDSLGITQRHADIAKIEFLLQHGLWENLYDWIEGIDTWQSLFIDRNGNLRSDDLSGVVVPNLYNLLREIKFLQMRTIAPEHVYQIAVEILSKKGCMSVDDFEELILYLNYGSFLFDIQDSLVNMNEVLSVQSLSRFHCYFVNWLLSRGLFTVCQRYCSTFKLFDDSQMEKLVEEFSENLWAQMYCFVRNRRGAWRGSSSCCRRSESTHSRCAPWSY